MPSLAARVARVVTVVTVVSAANRGKKVYSLPLPGSEVVQEELVGREGTVEMPVMLKAAAAPTPAATLPSPAAPSPRIWLRPAMAAMAATAAMAAKAATLMPIPSLPPVMAAEEAKAATEVVVGPLREADSLLQVARWTFPPLPSVVPLLWLIRYSAVQAASAATAALSTPAVPPITPTARLIFHQHLTVATAVLAAPAPTSP